MLRQVTIDSVVFKAYPSIKQCYKDYAKLNDSTEWNWPPKS